MIDAGPSDGVRYGVHDHVARITLCRPERGNVVNLELLTALEQRLAEAGADRDVRAVVLEGSGGVFCRGMDFRALLAARSAGQVDEAFSAPYARVALAIRDSAKPVVAAVDGEVLAGGMGLALACDAVLATRRSTFALSEVLFGLIPAYVFPFLLERVPLKRARYLTVASRRLEAEEAARFGLVDELVDDDGLERKLTELLRRLLASSPDALALVKRYSDLVAREPIADAVRAASAQLTALLNQRETVDAIAAFLDGEGMAWAASYRRPRDPGAAGRAGP